MVGPDANLVEPFTTFQHLGYLENLKAPVFQVRILADLGRRDV